MYWLQYEVEALWTAHEWVLAVNLLQYASSHIKSGVKAKVLLCHHRLAPSGE